MLLSLAFGVTAAFAQAPDLSGTWKLDRPASTISSAAGLAGMGAGGIVDMLHVTHAANGTVTVGSEINESQARLYRPGAASPLPGSGGPGGPGGPSGENASLTSRWDGSTLIGEAPDLRETFTLSPDGGTLTVTVTTRQNGKEATSRLVYTRAVSLGTCDTWPTPCRR